MPRPYVLLSVATSIDGYIDDTSAERLVLSNAADFDRVDAVRAKSDAILVGAGTLRADNPRLVVRSEARKAARVAQGRPEHPLKVTVSGSGKLDPSFNFWHTGGDKLAYTTDSGYDELHRRLNGLAEVVTLGPKIDFRALLDDLSGRGVRSLLVEGGGSIHTALLSTGLADEIHLAIAPILVGQADAPRFLHPATFPGAPHRRMRLVETKQIDDVALLRYLVKTDD